MTWYQVSHMDSLWEPYKFWGPTILPFEEVNITFRKKKDTLSLFHFPTKLDSPLTLGHSIAFDHVSSFLLKII